MPTAADDLSNASHQRRHLSYAEKHGGRTGIVETLAEKLVKSLLAAINLIVGGVYDTGLSNNPDAFAILNDPVIQQVLPGTPYLAIQNTTEAPVLVRVQAVADIAGGTKSFLFLGTTNNNTKNGTAPSITIYDVAPKASVVVPPNRSLYIDGTTPGGGSAAFNVMITTQTYRGRASIYPRA